MCGTHGFRGDKGTQHSTLWDWHCPGYIKAVLKVRTCLLKKLTLMLKVIRLREELNMPLAQTALSEGKGSCSADVGSGGNTKQ